MIKRDYFHNAERARARRRETAMFWLEIILICSACAFIVFVTLAEAGVI